MSTATRAELGQRETCDRCGRRVTLRTIARDAFTGAPINRWVARRTKRAPTPAVCPAAPSTSGYHRAEGYSVDGTPL